MKMKKSIDVYVFARTSLLSALAIVLSFLEGILPELPVPGAKPGLANLAVMTAVDLDGLSAGICVALVKVFFAVLTRGPVAGFMSLCGSLLSTAAMWLALSYDRQKFGYVGIGVIGAVCHNMGQLAAAFSIMGSAVGYYAPFLIITAVFTGAFTGIINSVLLPIIKKSEKHNIYK